METLQKALLLLAPNQAGALWIGLIVFFLLLGHHRRFISRRNGALLGLLLAAPLLVDIFRWEGHPRAPWFFTALYLVTAFYAVWGYLLAVRSSPFRWKPRVGRQALLVLLAALLVLDMAVVFGRPPDDAGYFTNLGARRLLETGQLPYADAKLKGPDAPGFGAAATYGPLLYLSHVPFQWILGAENNPADADPMDRSYVRPPNLATQAATFVYFLLALFALYRIVRRFAGSDLGISAAILFAASPYIMGLGGDRFLIGGLVYISHIAPPAMVLLALLAVRRPWVSGLLLSAGAGLLFYPAFLFPLWLGWFFPRKREALRFALGFLVGGLLIVGFVVLFTPSTADAGSISLFLESTLEHQEGVGSREYGLSAFGFWGTHPRLAGFFQSPLFGASVLFKPIFMLFAFLCLASFFIARGRNVAQLAGLTAMISAAVQLWKSHAAGTYVEWFLPFLIIALLAATRSDRETGIEA